MEEKVFSFVDLSEGDHELATFKYVGDDISNNVCFVAVSLSACSLFSSVTEELNPVGFFIITINDIINTVDYANGSDPCTKFIRSYRNEVFKIDQTTLILLENPEICAKESINAIFELVKPEQIFIFSTISKSLFKTETEFPKIYCMSTQKEKEMEKDSDKISELPFPNQFQNVSAGLLILGEVRNIRVKAFQVVEDPKGPTVDSMTLLLNQMVRFVPTDIPNKAKQACHFATVRCSNSSNIL